MCVTTVTTAMPVVNAMASAKMMKIFFMNNLPFSLNLPELACGLRDSRHVLELFPLVAADHWKAGLTQNGWDRPLRTRAAYAGDQAELNQKLKASAGLSFDRAPYSWGCRARPTLGR